MTHSAATLRTVGTCMGPLQRRSSRRRDAGRANVCCTCVVHESPPASVTRSDARVCVRFLTCVVDTSLRSRTRRDTLLRHSM